MCLRLSGKIAKWKFNVERNCTLSTSFSLEAMNCAHLLYLSLILFNLG